MNRHSTETQSTIEQAMLAIAVRHFRAGAWSQADTLVRHVLEQWPNSADALQLSGVVAMELGQIERAEQALRGAIARRPTFAAAHYNLGRLLRRRDQLGDAIRCYRQAIVCQPEFAAAYNNLGTALKDEGKPIEAIGCYRQALAIDPGSVTAHFNLGLTLSEVGRLDAAAAAYRETLDLNPAYAPAHDSLGKVWHRQGKVSEAVEAFERAVEVDPRYVSAYNNLGNALVDSNRFEPAATAYRQALAIEPGHANTHCNLGHLHAKLGQYAAAERSFRAALRHDPELVQAMRGLAGVLVDQERLGEAARCYRRALAIAADCASTWTNLGKVLQGLNQLDEARDACQRALDNDPDHAPALVSLSHLQQQLCAWDRLDDLGRQLDRLLDHSLTAGAPVAGEPFAHLVRSRDPARNLLVARSRSAEIAAQAKALGLVFRVDRRATSDRIRLGYLSSDFRDHPVALHLLGVLRSHCRTRFEVTAYSYGPDDKSCLRQEIAGVCDRFIDLRFASVSEAARRIQEDHVDILIDLNGHTRGNRLTICALRPAPIQLTYFGFPGTSGADFFDYAVVDPVVVPSEHASSYTEKLVYLPASYQPNDYPEPPRQAPSRTEHGLPEETFVLASFNQSYKIDAAIFDVWMRVLKAVPNSVLWLHRSHGSAATNLLREATKRGVTPNRLIFAERLPLAQHLARLRLVDLALDTAVYNGGSTTSNALWAGVPVITVEGSHFASRMGASVLNAFGLPQLITAQLEDYEALAVHLATDNVALEALKHDVACRRNTASLFDVNRFVRRLEMAYHQIWSIHLAGETPRQISVE